MRTLARVKPWSWVLRAGAVDDGVAVSLARWSLFLRTRERVLFQSRLVEGRSLGEGGALEDVVHRVQSDCGADLVVVSEVNFWVKDVAV
jgi:hypothetical protein